MKKSLKIIRIVTVAPIMAFLLYTLTFIFRREFFPSAWHYIYSVICLTVLPLLAYPLQRFIPPFKNKGRDGQRTLAIIFSVVGYLLCCLFGLIFDQPSELWLITLVYLFSGVCILISSKLFKFKISGHACGVLGPVFVLFYFGLYAPAIIGLFIAAFVYYASLASERHTLPELVGGSILPAILMLLFVRVL